MDAKALRRVFFWGSLGAAIVYCIWIWTTLLSIRCHNPEFFRAMAAGKVDVGALVDELSSIAGSGSFVRSFVWIISICAVGTSIIGVGIGLCTSLGRHLSWDGAPKFLSAKICVAVVATVPPAMLAIAVPSAFTTVLGFAGIILASLALFIPIFLLLKGKFTTYFYPAACKNYSLLYVAICGIAVVASELGHILL